MAGGHLWVWAALKCPGKPLLGADIPWGKKWGWGSISYRKTGAKDSQHLISIYFSFCSRPRQHSEELAYSFLEACLAQSLCLQLSCILLNEGFPHSSLGKESACNAEDPGSIPGLGRSPGEGKGYPLQYSGLENSMDYVRGVAKSRTRLSYLHLHLHHTAYWRWTTDWALLHLGINRRDRQTRWLTHLRSGNQSPDLGSHRVSHYPSPKFQTWVFHTQKLQKEGEARFLNVHFFLFLIPKSY